MRESLVGFEDSVLAATLFNIFTDDLGENITSSVIKFVGDKDWENGKSWRGQDHGSLDCLVS